MSTNALAHFIENDEKLCTIYKHWDGSPEDFGLEIIEFINSGKFVNCLGLDNNMLVFNGVGDCVAQLIAHIKDRPGDVYMYHPKDDLSTEYSYYLNFDEKVITVYSYFDEIFQGTFIEFVKKYSTLEHCSCGKLATWIYMPGFANDNSPFFCDDCVVTKDEGPCSCNFKHITSFTDDELKELKEGLDYKFVVKEDLIKLNPNAEVLNFVEGALIYYLNDNGRPYPCAEYEYNEEGFEK